MAVQPFEPWSLFQCLNPIHSLQDSSDQGGGAARRNVAIYTQNNTNAE
jgi:hypothetical protein